MPDLTKARQPMIKIYTATDPLDAHIVKGLLESHGILCEVRGETLFGGRGELPLVTDTLPSLWLADSDAEKCQAAAQVIAQYEENRHNDQGDGQPGWHCALCGEYQEPQFTACWRCGEQRALSPELEP